MLVGGLRAPLLKLRLAPHCRNAGAAVRVRERGCFTWLLSCLASPLGGKRQSMHSPPPRTEVQDRCDYAVRMALDAADTVKGNGLTQEQLLGHLGWPWGGFGVGFPTALLTGRPMPKKHRFVSPLLPVVAQTLNQAATSDCQMVVLMVDVAPAVVSSHYG